MQKRYIRLKEMTPGTDRIYTPTDEQLETTDGSPAGRDFRCRVDAEGFILTGNAVSSSPPIVFMGDSFVESMFASEDQRFVSEIERMIAKTCLNAGYSGSTTLQLLNSLLNKVYPAVGRGSTIVLCPPHSDRDNIYKDGRYWNNSQRGATLLPPGRPGHESIPEGLTSFEQIMRIFITATRELGLHLILVTTPFRIADFSNDAPLRRIYRRDRELYRLGLSRRRDFCQRTRTLALQTDTPLIDLEATVSGRPEYFYDELHLNPAGHRLVADTLAPQLGTMLDTWARPITTEASS